MPGEGPLGEHFLGAVLTAAPLFESVICAGKEYADLTQVRVCSVLPPLSWKLVDRCLGPRFHSPVAPWPSTV